MAAAKEQVLSESGTPRGMDLRWQWLILIGALGALLYWLRPVLMPFAVAALFAYLFDPLVDRL